MSALKLGLRKALARFGASRGGNVALLWALCGVVLIGLVGLTVDFTRAQTLRSAMQNAADGAVLVAERASHLPLPERTAAARGFFDAAFGDQPITGDIAFQLIPLEAGGHRVTASGEFNNGLSLVATLLGNGASGNWRVGVTSEAVAQASPPIEVALVLDNTGSMRNDMDTLRDAATDLAESLFELGGDTVSVSLVPFVAQVNVGSQYRNAAWMDSTGISPYNGALLEDRQIARITWTSTMGANCENLSRRPWGTRPDGYTGAGNDYTGPYLITWVRDGTRCRAFTPAQINYFTLFDLMPGAPWKGCVEARTAYRDLDITDTAPSAAEPETLFSPFFWIDTGGEAGDSNSSSSTAVNYRSSNTYLDDSRGVITRTRLAHGTTTNQLSSPPAMTNGNSTTNMDQVRRAHWFNVFKYRGDTSSSYVSFDETPDSNGNTRGPNRGCPTPIVPLTTDPEPILDGIADMVHWNGGGTNQVEGLVWGWRVLSPGAPFTQGRPYNDPNDPVRKVIVLMSDGQNTNVGSDAVYRSDYAALNHLGLWADWDDGSLLSSLGQLVRGVLPNLFRRSISSSSAYVAYINDRERRLCQNIKDEGIEIYTVIFRETDGETRDLMRNCATDADHYFTADSAAELHEAFAAIGSGIGQLRLTH